MAIGIHRNAQVVIDENILYQNIHKERLRLPKDTQLFMVVKANGYGHGAIEVAKVARYAGANGFCVAILDEALELRKAGFHEPILVLGITNPKYAKLAADNRISLTVSSLDWLKTITNDIKPKFKFPLSVHLALDTGMGRIGFQDKISLASAIHEMNEHKNNFYFEGIFTHFSTADSTDDDYFNFQLKSFKDLMQVVNKKPKYVHVSNSATSLWHSSCNGNMIRFGAAGYGLNPSGEVMNTPYSIKGAMSVTSEIAYCKKVSKGRSIGYGATYTLNNDQWIGTVPIGYADGISRHLQNFYVLVDGNYCQIVGRICMDQFMIRLPYPIATGTKVTLVGKDGKNKISLQDVADYCGTIHYEIACGYSNRLPRVYVNKIDH